MDNRLKSLLPSWATRRRRRQRRSAALGSVTVLDVDGATLRVAQAHHGATVKRVLSAPLGFPPDADRTNPLVVGAAVKQALASLKLSPATVVMGVGRPRVVLRTLRLPVVQNQAELASLVQFQVTQDLPFRPEEAVIDFKVGREVPRSAGTSKPDEGARPEPAVARMEVLVAAVKRDEVEFHQQVAAAAGLKLAALGLLPDANARYMEACKVAEDTGVLALVTLRPDEVGVDVMAGHSLIFSRGTVMRAIGETPHIEGAVPVTVEAFVEAAAIEAVRSLRGYDGTEPNRPVDRVVVAGGTGLEAALVEAMRQRAAVPCSQLEPTQALRLPAEYREAAAGSIGAIGLALGCGDESGLPFDFLNPKRPAVHRNLRRIRLVSAAAAVAVLLLMVFGMRKMLVDRRTRILNAVSAELAQAEKNRPIYRSTVAQAGLVNDWLMSDRRWLHHYAYLASVLPPSEDVYLTAFSVDNQGVVRLAVQARSGEILARLNKQLQAGGYEVKPFAINPGANRFGYEFRSNVEMKSSPKLKVDLAKIKPVARPTDDVSLDPQAWRKGGQ